MPISIAGSGTITGISAGGLPDDCITTAEIAANAVTTAKLGSAEASGLAKAWVNFNGTGTVAIRASYNVSSITDNGTGDYTVNFTTALADANYCVDALAGYRNSISAIIRQFDSPTQSTTAIRLTCAEGTGALADTPQFNVAIFR
jgi:hypothetical protein